MSDLIASDRVSAAGRAVHDLGAAALFGGNLFARVGMHPALSSISEPRERGVVVNRAWRRYGTVNSLSLVAVLVGWGLARREESADAMLSARERQLAQAKDYAAVAVAVTGVAAALAGVLFAQMEPDGAVPLAHRSSDPSRSGASDPTLYMGPSRPRATRLARDLSRSH